MTLTEKILARGAGKSRVAAGENIWVNADILLTHDVCGPGSIAGKNFGCGSSREHAPIALGAAGVEVVVAESYARIFFRNSVATGELYPYESAQRLIDRCQTGDTATIDFGSDTLELNGEVYALKPMGDVRPVIEAGGLFNYARKTGMIAS